MTSIGADAPPPSGAWSSCSSSTSSSPTARSVRSPYPALALAAAVVAWIGARRATTDRRAVRYFAIGLTFSAIGALRVRGRPQLGGRHPPRTSPTSRGSCRPSSYVVGAVELARSSGTGAATTCRACSTWSRSSS